MASNEEMFGGGKAGGQPMLVAPRNSGSASPNAGGQPSGGGGGGGKKKKKIQNPLKTDRKTIILATVGELLSELCPDWLEFARDNPTGHYASFDVNVPRNLPTRSAGQDAYMYDSPLTEIAYLEAKLLGHKLARQGIQVPKDIWSAPEYSCVQSAGAILKGMDAGSAEIRIEPSLCDIGSRYKNTGEYPFMEHSELKKAHLIADADYRPYPGYTINDITRGENLEQFYTRGKKLMNHITYSMSKSSSSSTATPTLIVGPRANMEVWSRGLMNLPPRDASGFERVYSTITPNAIIFMEQDPKSKRWNIIDPPVYATMTHSANASFDWHIYDHVNL